MSIVVKLASRVQACPSLRGSLCVQQHRTVCATYVLLRAANQNRANRSFQPRVPHQRPYVFNVHVRVRVRVLCMVCFFVWAAGNLRPPLVCSGSHLPFRAVRSCLRPNERQPLWCRCTLRLVCSSLHPVSAHRVNPQIPVGCAPSTPASKRT